LEFSRTRAHYLVFKEQIPLINIVAFFLPLSRGLLASRRPPSPAATAFVTDTRFPVKHLFGLSSLFSRPEASLPPGPKCLTN
jgi:hypothetical protein